LINKRVTGDVLKRFHAVAAAVCVFWMAAEVSAARQVPITPVPTSGTYVGGIKVGTENLYAYSAVEPGLEVVATYGATATSHFGFGAFPSVGHGLNAKTQNARTFRTGKKANTHQIGL
jgi:hypothetical protein